MKRLALWLLSAGFIFVGAVALETLAQLGLRSLGCPSWLATLLLTPPFAVALVLALPRYGALDLGAHLRRQRAFSLATFGPGTRSAGVIDHIRKELREIEQSPCDLEEWIDVVLLALDGAWRSGASPDEIVRALDAKQTKNEGRSWPDWRTADPNQAIEHVRTGGDQ